MILGKEDRWRVYLMSVMESGNDSDVLLIFLLGFVLIFLSLFCFVLC